MKHIKPYVIGIIGGSGTGKTYFANYMTDYYSAAFIEGDQIGRDVILEEEVVQAIQLAFGKEVIVNGLVNRQKLGSMVFGHRGKLDQLNEIMHPKMKRTIGDQIQRSSKSIVILEAAVMIEAKFHDYVDTMFCIKADDDVRIKRLIEGRHIATQKASQMIASGRDDYDTYGNYLVDSTWGLEYIKEDLDRILDELREATHEKND